MRKFGYLQFTFITCLVLMFFSCSKDEGPESFANRHDTFLTLSVSLPGDYTGDYDKASDKDNPGIGIPNRDRIFYEDKVAELRIIIFDNAKEKAVFNEKYTSGLNRVKFNIGNAKDFELFAIANESASGQVGAGGVLDFLKDRDITREQIKACKGIIPINMDGNINGKGAGGKIMMTAHYTDLHFDPAQYTPADGNGTEANPYKLSLERQNRLQRPDIKGDRSSIELMRSLAKIGIIMKDVVYVSYENGQDNPTYEWVLPYGFTTNSKMTISLLNIPRDYTLFPDGKERDLAIDKENRYVYSIGGDSKIDKKCLVNLYPEDSDPDDPIGGLQVLGYMVYFYVPEYLMKNDPIDDALKPGFKIEYQEDGKPMKSFHSYLINNRDAGMTQYETVLVPTLGDIAGRADWNIYRDRYYRIGVNITGKDFSPFDLKRYKGIKRWVTL